VEGVATKKDWGPTSLYLPLPQTTAPMEERYKSIGPLLNSLAVTTLPVKTYYRFIYSLSRPDATSPFHHSTFFAATASESSLVIFARNSISIGSKEPKSTA
jgi:hypothetical protein